MTGYARPAIQKTNALGEKPPKKGARKMTPPQKGPAVKGPVSKEHYFGAVIRHTDINKPANTANAIYPDL